ncbi:hypothetical protein CHUAL_006460 [Chamberlinius hualienensis]
MDFRLIFVAVLFRFASATTIAPVVANETEISVRPKLNLTVVYATLCPDSKGFIGEQLWPTYQSGLGSIFDITFVPWGKATYARDGDRWRFSCQHGPKECYGNKVHACVLDLVKDFNQTFSFIHCSMTGQERKAPNEYEACAVKNGIDWNRTTACADGTEGDNLLQRHGEFTASLKPPLVFVPWIVVNGRFRGPTLELALDNLPKVICDAYGNPKPAECPAA